MPIKRQSISLNYYQYSYDTNTGKWKDPVEVMYKGVFWKNKAISLMINLNRITHEPFNKDALYFYIINPFNLVTLLCGGDVGPAPLRSITTKGCASWHLCDASHLVYLG